MLAHAGSVAMLTTGIVVAETTEAEATAGQARARSGHTRSAAGQKKRNKPQSERRQARKDDLNGEEKIAEDFRGGGVKGSC